MARRPLSVGALAVVDRRANAVGPLRLTCERDALRIDLLYVGRFSLGYVAASVADAVSVRVPYAAVRVLMRDGDRLLLSIDARVMRPYNRFALTHFGSESLPGLMRLHRRRTIARWLVALLPLALGVATAFSLLNNWRLPEVLAVAAGVSSVSLALGVLLLRLADRLNNGAGLRDALENEVSRRMGLQLAPPLRDPDARVLQELSGRPAANRQPALAAGARPRWLALALLSSLLMGLLSLHLVQRFGVKDEVLLDVPRGRIGWARQVAGLSTRAGTLLESNHPSCECKRAASPYWAKGVPQLSFLLTSLRGGIEPLWLEPGKTYPITHPPPRPPEPERKGKRRKRRRSSHLRVAFELAVVNNSAVTLDTVSLVTTFAQRDAQSRRHAVIERGLHWPKKLGPGRAVKWTVRAEGNEVRLDSPNTAMLGVAGLKPAPVEAFAAQRDARLAAVRVHCATMLTYLQYDRAAEFINSLGPLGRRELVVANTLSSAFEELLVCDGEAGAPVCILNRSKRILRGVSLSARGAKTPRWEFTDLFYPGQALALSVDTPLAPHQLKAEPLVANKADVRAGPAKGAAPPNGRQ